MKSFYEYMQDYESTQENNQAINKTLLAKLYNKGVSDYLARLEQTIDDNNLNLKDQLKDIRRELTTIINDWISEQDIPTLVNKVDGLETNSATKEYVSTAITNAQLDGAGVDVSMLATSEQLKEVQGKIDALITTTEKIVAQSFNDISRVVNSYRIGGKTFFKGTNEPVNIINVYTKLANISSPQTVKIRLFNIGSDGTETSIYENNYKVEVDGCWNEIDVSTFDLSNDFGIEIKSEKYNIYRITSTTYINASVLTQINGSYTQYYNNGAYYTPTDNEKDKVLPIELVYRETKNNSVSYEDLTKTQINLENKITEATSSLYATNYHAEEDYLVQRVLNEKSKNTIIFSLATDTHTYSSEDNYWKHGKVLKKLSQRCGVDFIVHLGDMITSLDEGTTEWGLYSDEPHSEMLKRIDGYLKYMTTSNIPFVFAKGNHDVTGGRLDWEWRLTDTNIYNLTNRYNKILAPVKNSGKNYYYFDIENVRFIVLDTCEGTLPSSQQGCVHISDNQLNWLENVLNNSTDMKIVFLSHVPLNLELFSEGLSETSYTSLYTLLTNFVSNNGIILCCIYGHAHCDNTYFDETLRTNFIGVGCGIPTIGTIKTKLGSPIIPSPRTKGTYSEYLLDIFSIDIDTGDIKTFRFGAGNDKTIGGIL